MLLRGVIQSLCNLTEEQATANTDFSRRHFLKLSGAATGLLLTTPALALNTERCLSIYCPNTSETLRLVYWTPTDGYIEESIHEVSLAMRDRRNDKVKRIDHRLLDQMFALQSKIKPPPADAYAVRLPFAGNQRDIEAPTTRSR